MSGMLLAFLGTGSSLLGRITRLIPPWAWIAAAVVVVVLLYGHSIAKRVRAEMEAIYNKKTQEEVLRQAEVNDKAVNAAMKRARDAEQRVKTLEVHLNDAVEEAKKAKDAARVCLPASVTNKLRGSPAKRRRSR